MNISENIETDTSGMIGNQNILHTGKSNMKNHRRSWGPAVGGADKFFL